MNDATSETPIELTAGPVSALLYHGDLRHVRIGDVEIAQRIYVAVRDEVWNTIPGEIAELEVRSGGGTFTVDFTCQHRYRDIDFVWRARIRGDGDGAISYEMAGSPRTAFRYAKIGLNVHHPLRECLGRPYRANTSGGEISGILPVEIEPQLIVDGQLTALFPEYDALTIELAGGIEARFSFSGDVFEMQDHRNWTDANLKSYAGPLSRPWPFDARPGEALRQVVRVASAAKPPRPLPAAARRSITLSVEDGTLSSLPPLGLTLDAEEAGLSARQVRLLRAVRPAHLRLDLIAADPAMEDQLIRGTRMADTLEASLELAVFTTEATVEDVRRLASVLERERAAVARVLVFAGGTGFSATDGATTPARLVRAVRERLAGVLGGVPYACGTNQFFTELNRNRPEIDGVDGIAYSINPQVHAADDLSLMENLEPQAETVRMTRALGGGLPVFVSPVTLIGRSGPFPGGPPERDGLPGNVDVRQASLFCAAWTVGSLRQLAGSGAAALTYFSTRGHRGLVELEDADDLDQSFPSRPGDVFPVYHVLADVAGLERAEVAPSASADPRYVELLAVRDEKRLRVLVANLTQRSQAAVLELPGAGRVEARALDDSTVSAAMVDPAGYRRSIREMRREADETVVLELPPFAVCRIDVARDEPLR